VLPKEFDRERKQGFSIPLGEWLKEGAFKALFYDTLRSEGCSFDKQTVDDLIAGQENGRSNGERLFALVLFELWRKDYGVTF
jgi:asparagine synthase (glutamine-hydrolysing)